MDTAQVDRLPDVAMNIDGLVGKKNMNGGDMLCDQNTAMMKQYLIQHLLLGSIDDEVSEDLSYHVVKGDGGIRKREQGLMISSDLTLDFCSCFNSFSASKWKKYTTVRSVGLMLLMDGKAEITLYRDFLTRDEIKRTIVKKFDVDTRGKEKVFLDGGMLPDDGTLSFAIKADGKPVTLWEGYYTTDDPRNVSKIKLAVVYTTYQREEEIQKNLAAIESLHNPNIYTYVVDNAGTLKLKNSDSHTLISNRNTGGAGGFARGMMEIAKDLDKRKYTHFLLMDDDTLLDPRILIRTMRFLSLLKEEYRGAILGGAMLDRERTNLQVESGAVRNGIDVVGYGYGMDLGDPVQCMVNDLPRKEEYNAWWYCVMPIDLLRDDNYPLPLFYQWDDVDYGIRNRRPLILMNGVCVWHEAFETKQSDVRLYYSIRNPMIVDASHEGSMGKKRLKKRLFTKICYQLILYRYSGAEMILKGIEDFLRGPEWLRDLDAEAHHREILFGETPKEKIEDLDYNSFQVRGMVDDCDKLHKTVRKLTINGLLLKADRTAILPMSSMSPASTYRAKKVLYYDEQTGVGIWQKKDLKRMCRILRETLHVFCKLDRNYDRLEREYKAMYPLLHTKAYWTKVFEEAKESDTVKMNEQDR